MICLVLFCVSSLSLLTSCSLKEGNESEDVNEAIRLASEQFGVQFELKHKARLPGGLKCDVTVTCPELPGKEIRVLRYDNHNPVQTDYIYVKYGQDAYDIISKILDEAVPDCKYIIQDFCYNHFPSRSYDANTDLKTYLSDNCFEIYVFYSGIHDQFALEDKFMRCAESLVENGINCEKLCIYCLDTQDTFDGVKTYSHIPDLIEAKPFPIDHIIGRAESDETDLFTTMSENTEDSVYIHIK